MPPARQILSVAFVVGVGTLFVSAARAQAVTPATAATAQPLVFRDGATITGCGLRVLAVSGVGLPRAAVADFSVMATVSPAKRSLNGLLKAGLYEGEITNDPSKMKNVPIESFFLTNEDGSLSAIPTKLVPAENKGFLLGITEADIALNLASVIEDGGRLQIALRPKGQGFTNLYSFKAEMSDEERSAYAGCMTGFLRTLDAVQKDLEAKPD